MSSDAPSAFQDWDKTEDGRLKVWPFLGFATAVFQDGRGGLRLEVGAPPAPGTAAAAVQVSFDEGQLRMLSDALAEVADRLASGRTATGAN